MSDPSAADQVTDLKNLGATSTEIAIHAGNLEELQLVRTLWPGERRYTMADAARLLDVEVGQIIDIRVACGFNEPAPTVRVATDKDLEFYAMVLRAQELFGRDELMKLLRVIAVSVSRIADAATSTYLVQLAAFDQEADESSDDVGDLHTAQSIETIGLVVPELSTAMETLLRKHLVAARRRGDDAVVAGTYETTQLVVGFADLAGSTQLTDRLTFEQIGHLLSRFEEVTSSVITRFGGRVVKLIGDEILFTVDDPVVGARMGWAIAEQLRDLPNMPQVRVGMAAGEVLRRDGDIFGPPVNRAARLVKAATPGTVVVTPVIQHAATKEFEMRLAGTTTLPGFSTATELWQLVEPTGSVEPKVKLGEME